MKGFIVYPTYENIDEQTYIQLFGRLENNESFVAVIKFNPYFYIKESDFKKIEKKIEESKCKIEKTKMHTFDGEKVVKIISSNFTTISKLSKELNDNFQIKTYEADIKPHMRYIIGKDLLGNIEIKGDYENAERVDRVYKNPEIKGLNEEFQPKLKVISLDIESSKTNDELLCISLYSKNYEKTFIVSEKKVENAIICKNEEELLEKFKKEIIEFDPDIITGWNVIDFDFNYLKQKFEKYKIRFDLGRTNDNARIRIEGNFFRNSTMDIPGRLVLDGLTFIKDPQIQEAPTIKHSEFESYTLEDVSQELLGKGKLIKGKSRHDELEKLYEVDREKLVQYNLLDAKLVYEILEKTKMIELSIERSQLTGLPLDKTAGSIANFDSLYIREANKRNLVSATTSFGSKEEKIKGGFVMSPKPGLYENVLVFDFKSLYPSIIRTFNIDPASFMGKVTDEKKKNCIIAPNNACFKNQEGILPGIIERLFHAREKAKKEKRELSSYAIKVIMNSFFGVLASPNCRYYNLDMANAITSFGQEIIKLTAKKIEEKGFKVIYSDTDSVFVYPNLSIEKVKELGKKIEADINNFYKDYVKERYNRDSKLELEFEKLYLSLLIPQLRTKIKKEEEEKEIAGAKKRYAGLVEKDGKKEIEITGLEAIRGDWTEAAKEFQIKLLEKIFNKENVIPFIKFYVKELREGKLDSKLIYRKSIRKELEEYIKTTPPHVKAARQLEKLESSIIEYVMTTEGPEPIQKIKHKLDYEHYIEKQIKPIAKTILETSGIDFEEAIKGSKQKTLF